MRPRSLSNVLVTLATAGSIVVASPAQHRHHHAHVQERAIKTVEVPGPTVIAYDLNGKLLDQSEVCEGIKAGTLQWKDGNVNSRECSTQTTSVEPTSSATAAVPYITPTTLATQPIRSAISQVLSASPTTTSLRETLNDFVKEAVHVSPSRTLALTTGSSLAAESPIEVSSSTSKSTSSSAKAAPSASESSTFTPSSTTGGQGLDQEFPDGEIDCTTFPSEYGPIEVEWANLGGWSGIQYVTIEGSTVTHIDTAVPGGHGCKPGAMCSYACPPGYQKSQWPSVQGATGQSVGGLSCNSDGKLALTNPGLSKNLCIQGTGAVTVQNKMSNNAAICRTDYPGTEDETVPLNSEPDSTSPLTCPDASTYFRWKGDSTTAQYYVNNQGVALQDACIWATDGSDMGNWAPSYFGVGQDVNGKTWLSIASTAQNYPSSYTPLNYTVKITGNTSGKCGLSNGRYCSGENYNECNTRGCTVELLSGQATYVLEDGSSLSD